MNSRTNDSNQQALGSRAIANNVSSKHSDSGYLPFEDNRAMAIQQRKLIEFVNSKPLNTVAQFAKGSTSTTKTGKKGKTSIKKKAGKKPIHPKRPHFLSHIKKARMYANAIFKKKGIKIHMAHRMSWEKIAQIISDSKGDPNNLDFLNMVEVVTVPNRNYGKLKKGDKTLYNIIMSIAKSSLSGTLDPKIATLLNSSIINLRPGNGKINSSIQGKNDYNYVERKKGKKMVRARSPISDRLHKRFPDKNPANQSSSILNASQSQQFENNSGMPGN